jgi:Domain of unknown function (DUF1967)
MAIASGSLCWTCAHDRQGTVSYSACQIGNRCRIVDLRVQGEAIERFAAMTNWDYYESARRFQSVLNAAGVIKALKVRGRWALDIRKNRTDGRTEPIRRWCRATRPCGVEERAR